MQVTLKHVRNGIRLLYLCSVGAMKEKAKVAELMAERSLHDERLKLKVAKEQS